jgi:hypothetical protein
MAAPAYEGVAEKPLRNSLSSISATHSANRIRVAVFSADRAESDYADVCRLAVSAKRARAFGASP